MFSVPSSDPPSTPASRRQARSPQPTTTPAGPPPTGYTAQSFTPGPPPTGYTAQSFTPAGVPPPSSVFGGSYTNAFGNSRPDFGFSQFGQGSAKNGMFAVPSSPPQHFMDGMIEEEDEQDADAEDAEYYDDNNRAPDLLFGQSQPIFPTYSSLPAKHNMQDSQMFGLDASTRDAKRSRHGQGMSNPFRGSRASRLDSRQSTVAAIAKGLAKSAPPQLTESDDIILRSEHLLAQLDNSLRTDATADVDTLTVKAAQQLTDLWRKDLNIESISGGIGPKNQKSGFDKSNYLASLLLRLHHPFSSKQKPKSTSTPFGRSSRYMDLVLDQDAITTIPRSLLDWLNTYHNPFPDDLPEVLNHRPAPIAHEKFWDMVYATTLRGDLATAISLLEGADFTLADTAMDDGYDEPGYRGRQAEAAREVTDRCIDLLASCPAYADDDWDVKNAEWAIFRNRVRREISDLEAYAESESKDRDHNPNGANLFQESTTGPGRNGLSFSTASRRAESKVPWTVYQNLKIIYGQMQGQKDEISVCTQDWLETAIYLAVWWDGEEDDGGSGNMAASRHSMRHPPHIRPVDVSPTSAYRRQLTYAFATVTDDPEDAVFAVNTMDPMQVALACICEEDVEGVLRIIQGWSLPIASAVVEIAAAGGWLPQQGSNGQNLMDDFDRDDLMVLSHGQDEPSSGLERDDVMSTYAEYLASRPEFASSDRRTVKEGWDLACRVLSRLDNMDIAQRKIGQTLGEIPLASAERVDKILAVCLDIGLPDQVQAIAERYADTLAETSQSYGSALIYYARAHSQQKLRSTIDLLISMCLVQSAAFPPTSALDPQLHQILNDRRTAIASLARIDTEAADLISTCLSGYATLRRFYDMRDAEASSSSSASASAGSMMKPKARKREAAKAILALVESAAESIRGGLYDDETETVVQVDTLMALLCEALPLLNQHRNPLLTTPSLLILLRAVEDLEAVTPHVYEAAEALFKAAVQNYVDAGPGKLVPAQDLAKSVSGRVGGLTMGGSWGMVGSQGSIVSANGDATNGKANGKGTGKGKGGSSGEDRGDKTEEGEEEEEEEEAHRGWDWRAGAVELGRNVDGKTILMVLRTQVARDMATSWMFA